MESLLNRYRNITVLLFVILAQFVLLGVQMKNDQDVPFLRIWAVTAVTPLARVIESARGGSFGFLRTYVLLHGTEAENRRLQTQVDRLKLENIFLRNELSSADRVKALELFAARTPSKTLVATVITSDAGSSSKVVFIDRGSGAGVQRGMAVVTPDGIVGTVRHVYPTASEVLLITDPDFAAGVVSAKGHVRGTLKGQGTPICKVDYVPPEEKVEVGEWFYASGDDRIFPRGFPAGVVKSVHTIAMQPFQEILVEPFIQRGVEEVLVVTEGVHQNVPATPPVEQPVHMTPPVPAAGTDAGGTPYVPPGTEADKALLQYKAAGEAQSHSYGEGWGVPDFRKLPTAGVSVPAGRGPAAAPAATPAAAALTQPVPAAPVATPATPPAQPPAAGLKPTDSKPPDSGAKVNPNPQPAAKPGDATRRSNQAAGAPPGGPGR